MPFLMELLGVAADVQINSSAQEDCGFGRRQSPVKITHRAADPNQMTNCVGEQSIPSSARLFVGVSEMAEVTEDFRLPLRPMLASKMQFA